MKTALVTGACSGIGLAIARRLGKLGYTLVLVSQREQPLNEAAASIARESGVETHPLCIDLARSGAAEELHRAVGGLGLSIDVLVNNAGMYFFGEAVDADPARANAMLQLHVVTPSLLCALFGRQMRERRKGHILIVSSMSAWRDFPGIAYYGTSKKYLLGFARALRCELSVYGVNVTCLAPGATETSLYGLKPEAAARLKRFGLLRPPESVAKAGLDAMFRGKALCVPDGFTRLFIVLMHLLPQALIDFVRRRSRWLPPRT